VDAAIRALPEIRAYDHGEITRLIAGVCGDWSTTRRMLIVHKLMVRPGGEYRLTPRGEAVWRVERYVKEHYLRG
jgi:hypothetical protein